jgi:hypothetical protein
MEELFVKAMELLKSAEGASLTIAMVLEFAFRMIPSKKPLSLFHVIAGVSKLLGDFLLKLAKVLDKVLPQKVKEDGSKPDA